MNCLLKKVILLTSIIFTCSFMAISQPKVANLNSPYQNGELYIKVYLHIIRDNTGVGGLTPTEIQEVIDNIDMIYNPYDIFFDYCVLDYNCSSCLSYLWTDPQYLADSYLDGINGFIAPAGTNSNNLDGATFTPLPSQTFIAKIDDLLAPAHEMGHCLGLEHTFRDACTSNQEYTPTYDDVNDIYYNSTNCETTGDLVCDTPADPYVGGPPYCASNCGVQPEYDNDGNIIDYIWVNPLNTSNPPSLDPLGNKYIDPYGNMFKNIMSYRGPRQLITSGQNERIRGLIEWIPDVILDGYIQTEDLYINSLVEWHIDKVFDADVVIEDGGVLSVFSKLEFTHGHGIRVEPGGTLVLDGAELNKYKGIACSGSFGTTWKGISVDPGDLTSFAFVNILDAKITNAEIAIKTTGTTGIYKINSFGSIFENNVSSLSFYGATGNLWLYDNDFIIDQNYAHVDQFGDPLFREQITFSRSYVALLKSDIQNNTGMYLKKNGVGSYQSGLFMAGLNQSIVQNWKKGIYAEDVPDVGFTRLGSSEILNNEQGIAYVEGNLILRGNTVSILNNYLFGSAGNSYGVYGFGESYYDISNNIITNEYSSNYLNYFGINLTNTININSVEDNYLFRTKVGINPVFDNAVLDYNTLTAVGLKMLCNKFEETLSGDFSVVGAIDEYQGRPTLSAGNLFANTGSSSFNDYFVHSGAANTPNYYYGDETPDEKPDDYDGIHPYSILNNEDINQHRDCILPLYEPEEPGDGDTSDEDVKYTDIKNKKEAKIDTFDTQIDGGNTPDVITLIESANANTVEMVTQTLTDLGPWLSVTAAVALLEQAGEFTESQLVQILAASPDLLRKQPVKDYVFGTTSPLSQEATDSLSQYAGVQTIRAELEANISALSTDLSKVINEALGKVILKDGGPDFSSQRTWLARRGGFHAKLSIAESYIQEGDFTSAIAYLEDLSMDPALSIDQQNDMVQYKVLTNLLLTAFANNRNESELTATEIQSLENYANSSYDRTNKKARSILRFFYGYFFEDEPVELRTFSHKNPKESLKPDDRVIVLLTPNPNKGIFTVSIRPKTEENAIKKLIITDVLGKVLYQSDRNGSTTSFKIQLTDLTTGTYFYTLITKGKTEYNGKFIVN